MKIAELFAELGFKTSSSDELKLRDFTNTLSDLNLSSVLAAVGLGTAGIALGEFAKKAGEYSQNLQLLNVVTGLSTDELQQWERAVERAGGKAADLDSTVKGLQQMMVQIKLGSAQGNIAMQAFRILTSDDWLTMLNKISKALQSGVNPQLKTFLATQMGINEQMQRFLQTGGISDVKNSPFLDTSTLHEASQMWSEFIGILQRVENAGMHMATALKPEFEVLFGGLKLVAQFFESFATEIEMFNDVLAGRYSGVFSNRYTVNPGPNAGLSGVASQVNHFTFQIGESSNPHVLAKAIADEVSQVINQMRRKQHTLSI